MNFNETSGSQTFPPSWEEKITGSAYQDTVQDNFRGNFISLISRSTTEKAMADLIENHWKMLARDKYYTQTVNKDPSK